MLKESSSLQIEVHYCVNEKKTRFHFVSIWGCLVIRRPHNTIDSAISQFWALKTYASPQHFQPLSEKLALLATTSHFTDAKRVTECECPITAQEI